MDATKSALFLKAYLDLVFFFDHVDSLFLFTQSMDPVNNWCEEVFLSWKLQPIHTWSKYMSLLGSLSRCLLRERRNPTVNYCENEMLSRAKKWRMTSKHYCPSLVDTNCKSNDFFHINKPIDVMSGYGTRQTSLVILRVNEKGPRNFHERVLSWPAIKNK